MTTTENATETIENETTEAPTPKYPSYLDLAKATWKLAHKLSERGSGSYCDSGTNDYLRYFNLPELSDVDGDNDAIVDSYFTAWFNFKFWQHSGELPAGEEAALREDLARRVRVQLTRNKPTQFTTMNQWMDELGLEHLQLPLERYTYTLRARGELTPAQIQNALNAAFPEKDVESVRYY